MHNKSPLITNLFELQNNNSGENFMCLSLYRKIQTPHKEEIKKELKACILDLLRNREEVSSYNKLHQYIIDLVFEKIRTYNTYGKSLALFLKFKIDPEDLKHTNSLNLENIHLYFTEVELQNAGHVGRIFDLSQLFYMIDVSSKSMIIDISDGQAEVYIWENEKFEKILDLQNEFPEDYETKFTHGYGAGRSMVPQQGSFKANQKDIKYKTMFVNKVLDELDRIIQTQPKFENILIFHAHNYTRFVDTFTSKMNKYSDHEPMFINKNIKDESQLKQATLEIIKENTYQRHKQDWLNTKENLYDHYAGSWEEVSEAANFGKVDTLFLTPTCKHTGYVSEDNLISTYENLSHSRKVNNLTPWLINKVIETGGKVEIISSADPNNDVSAKLRF